MFAKKNKHVIDTDDSETEEEEHVKIDLDPRKHFEA